MVYKKKSGNFKPKGRQVKKESIYDLRQIVGKGSLKRELLIEYLHLIQDHCNYISSNMLVSLSHEMKIPLVEVWEVASFYDHFDIVKDSEEPPM